MTTTPFSPPERPRLCRVGAAVLLLVCAGLATAQEPKGMIEMLESGQINIRALEQNFALWADKQVLLESDNDNIVLTAEKGKIELKTEIAMADQAALALLHTRTIKAMTIINFLFV